MGALELVWRVASAALELVGLALPVIGVWVIAVLFLWSGYEKLKHPELATLALIDFGAIRRFDARLGMTLGAIELAVALALVVPASRDVGLAASALLLWFFSAAIYVNLGAGRNFACFCFGDVEGEISPKTLGRSLVLALLATYLMLAPGPQVTSLSHLVLGIVAAIALVFSIRLLAAVPSLRLRHSHGASVGIAGV